MTYDEFVGYGTGPASGSMFHNTPVEKELGQANSQRLSRILMRLYINNIRYVILLALFIVTVES